jgi:hypothetical protein
LAGAWVIAAGGEVIAAVPVFGAGAELLPEPVLLLLVLLLPQPAKRAAVNAHDSAAAQPTDRLRNVILRPISLLLQRLRVVEGAGTRSRQPLQTNVAPMYAMFRQSASQFALADE